MYMISNIWRIGYEPEPNPKTTGIRQYLKYKYISININYINTDNNSNIKND